MSEIDKMARELLAKQSEGRRAKAIRINHKSLSDGDRAAISAIRAALLTAPPGWKLVPVEPTSEMWEAASQIGVPYPSHSDYYRTLVAAAPEPK